MTDDVSPVGSGGGGEEKVGELERYPPCAMTPREMPAEFFDWSTWRAGSIHEFVAVCCEPHLIAAAGTLRRHAVGWSKAEDLPCRPKIHHTAVMFFKDGRHFWTHLRNREFEGIFR